LLAPNFEALKEWCKENAIEFSNKKDLIKEPQVNELFSGIVKVYNRSLSKDEQVKRFRIVPDEWTPDSGELSPTLKLKRRVLNDKYAALIRDIFSKEAIPN